MSSSSEITVIRRTNGHKVSPPPSQKRSMPEERNASLPGQGIEDANYFLHALHLNLTPVTCGHHSNNSDPAIRELCTLLDSLPAGKRGQLLKLFAEIIEQSLTAKKEQITEDPKIVTNQKEEDPEELAKAKDPYSQLAAAEIYINQPGEKNKDKAIPILAKLKSGYSSYVKARVAELYIKMGNKAEAVKILNEVQNDPDLLTRSLVSKLYTKELSRHTDAINFLKKLSENRDYQSRMCVAVALNDFPRINDQALRQELNAIARKISEDSPHQITELVAKFFVSQNIRSTN